MKKLFIIAFMLMCGINVSFGQGYVNPYLAMLYLRNSDLKGSIISAHRGLHYGYPDTPENSLRAIGRAAAEGIEAIELDVKLTKDGVPILSHDDNLARMTYNRYNPFNATGALSGIPNISEQTYASINNLRLRKINFVQNIPVSTLNGFMGVQDDETVSDLATALLHIKNNKLRLVVMLDIKDVPTALACWRIVKNMTDCGGEPFSKTVIFKMSLKALGFQNPIQGLINLGIVRRDPVNQKLMAGGANQSMRFVPVYNGSDVDKLIEVRPNLFSPLGEFLSIDDAVRGFVINYVYSEINAKLIREPNEIQWFNHLNGAYARSNSRGIFQPIQEVPKYDATDNYGFYENTGRCCYQLSDVYYASKFFDAREVADWRANLEKIYTYFNVIITDAPLQARTFLTSKGKRVSLRTAEDICSPGYNAPGRIASEETPVDDETKLLLYPNPSVDSFTLQYWADEATEANVKIINSVGQTAMEQNLNFEKGINQPTFNTASFVGGTYFVNMEVDGKVITRKLMIVK